MSGTRNLQWQRKSVEYLQSLELFLKMLQLLWIFIAGNSQWFRKNNYYPLKWHVVIYSSHKLAIDIQRTFYPRFLLDIIQLFYASTYTESYFLCIHLFTINLENFNSYVKALTTNTHPWVSNIFYQVFSIWPIWRYQANCYFS